MKRRIVLELAEDVLDHHCGRCGFVRAEQHGPMASGHPLCGAFGGKWLTTNGGLPRRLDECIAAEKAAERMVDVPMEHLQTIYDALRRAKCAPSMGGHPIDAATSWVTSVMGEKAEKR